MVKPPTGMALQAGLFGLQCGLRAAYAYVKLRRPAARCNVVNWDEVGNRFAHVRK